MPADWADQVPTSCNLPRSIASLDALFSFLGEHIEANAIDATTAYGLNLAAEELFTNMVRHNVGEGEFISVDLDVSDERIRLLLTDHEFQSDRGLLPHTPLGVAMLLVLPLGVVISSIATPSGRTSSCLKRRIFSIG